MTERLKIWIEYFYSFKVRRMLYRKVNNIYKHVIEGKKLIENKQILSKHKEVWRSFDLHVNCKWLVIYSFITEIYDANYIPEDIYYTEVEPRLNNKAFSKAYTDKNFYHNYLDHDILPEVILRAINGVYYTADYSNKIKIHDLKTLSKNYINSKFVIKPAVDTGGGAEVRVFTLFHDKVTIFPEMPGVTTFIDLIKCYKRDFVIQKYIEQHPFFEKFNPSSLNTIRIMTYRSLEDEKIVILHRILRMGTKGSIVDNQASGGIACGIKPTGVLSDYGVDKYGNKHFESNGVKFSSVGEIPFLDKINEIAIHIAPKFIYSRLLGMDFGIDKNGKVFLIEVNDSNNEINFYQMNNGPLFGDYTDEISRLCHLEPKSFVIDYYLK